MSLRTREDFNLSLESFSGPLDLLIYLINKNKVDIYDIPIVKITDQYLEYLSTVQEDILDAMSEFLIMASTLISIKTRMLLPRHNEEEEDPRLELAQQIVEYQRFQNIAKAMSELEKKGFKSLVRNESLPEEVQKFKYKPNIYEIFNNVDEILLRDTFTQLIKQAFDRIDQQRVGFGSIDEEVYTIEEQMLVIKAYFKNGRKLCFSKVIFKMKSKLEIIVTFLALLELVKLGEYRITQSDIYEDINISVVENG